ncbi:hypothetical protein E4U30_007763 [Claviceps sp. LM220 group G6]|nr:hypothetical protein E4U15_000522 [Claviceps sp. LM218 group G6]KAG6098624.1 hypothetical protein E4U30_007763 [Claviceps sp. LM220 group G6]KAG6101462.1 hypothetical protein E4U31_003656 [Claviceps sp. LM219 group G6]
MYRQVTTPHLKAIIVHLAVGTVKFQLMLPVRADTVPSTSDSSSQPFWRLPGGGCIPQVQFGVRTRRDQPGDTNGTKRVTRGGASELELAGLKCTDSRSTPPIWQQ